MQVDHSLWSFFADAGLIVKMVMLTLLIASVISWTFIVQRWLYIRRIREQVKHFEKRFWSGGDLQKLFDGLNRHADSLESTEAIFRAGFHEYQRLSSQGNLSHAAVMDGVQRAMRIAHSHEIDNLETHLSFLATVGSTSPYIGLFGTVWGIMTSFQALGQASQATIAMVAPGISEALIATAMGLFAAIPAVIAYNRYANSVERLINHYETFQEEFYSILHRQAA